jgi:hypothetical protein
MLVGRGDAGELKGRGRPECRDGVGVVGIRRAAPVVTSSFDWKKYAGQTIRVLMAKQPATDFIEPFIPEFEQLTGIKVNREKLGEDQQRQKLQAELTSGMVELDIFGSLTGQQGKAFMQAGRYEVWTLGSRIRATRRADLSEGQSERHFGRAAREQRSPGERRSHRYGLHGGIGHKRHGGRGHPAALPAQ